MTFINVFNRSIAATIAVAALFAMSTSADAQQVSAEREAELIKVLESDGPSAEKAIACKHLAVHGTAKAVPELAKLLPNEQLSSWTRIALEAIPGPEADEALRKATDSLKGNLLVGTINSIGVRRDAKSVEALAKRLADADEEVAAASAVAMGKIGNAAAAKLLEAALATTKDEVRSAVAEGCVLCAERFFNEGRDKESVALYDVVRKSDVPLPRLLEATRGAILARKQNGIPLLVEQFRSPEKSYFNIALSTAREFPGRDVDDALARELARAAPEKAALIVVAMADRKDTVVLGAIVEAAKDGPKQVRLAALNALGRVGNTSSLSLLLDCAIEKDAQIASVAKTALSEVPGEKIDKDLVGRLANPDPKFYVVLLQLIGERRINALSELLKAAGNSSSEIRTAALTSLGSTVPQEQLSVLIKQAVAPKYPEDVDVAQLALKTACVRMPDREKCSQELTAALDQSSVPTKIALLKIMGAVSGSTALKTIGAAAKNPDPQLQDVASELLGDWMTIDAAPVLLDLAETAPAEKFQIRCMRGYIKVARQFVMDLPVRIEMCKKAMPACKRTAERKLVIEVLRRYPHVEMLKMAVEASQDPELKDDAAQAALVIAQKIGRDVPETKELLAKIDLVKVQLEIVKAEYGAGSKQKDVTETLKKYAGDTAFVALPADNYNEVFGGDPAPDTPKFLKVQYTLNGKAGDVSIPENSLIILPVPREKK